MRSMLTFIFVLFSIMSYAQSKDSSIVLSKKINKLSKHEAVYADNAIKYKKYLIKIANCKQLPLSYYVPAKKPDD